MSNCPRNIRHGLSALAFAVSLSMGCFNVQLSHLKQAELLRENGQYEAAIQQYQIFIDERLHQPPPPGALNPYFYYLLIGDCYLKLDKADEAKSAYLTALSNDVDKPLVAGKLRELAAWFEKNKRFDDAIAILHEHRELDPLLFDLDIDRNHKEAIEAEDQSRSGSVQKESSTKDSLTPPKTHP
ncbi:MAG: tetratricopeptide repeat protein [Bdellovibrionota bacterium]